MSRYRHRVESSVHESYDVRLVQADFCRSWSEPAVIASSGIVAAEEANG